MAKTIAQAGLSTDPSITHYWTCDTDFTDSVGSANGTDTNTPTYTAGKFSNAITLASASSQYTTVANSIIPWGTNTIWVHLWFKLTATANTQSMVMTTQNSGEGFLIYWDGTVLDFGKPNVVDLTYTWAGKDTNYHMLDCFSNGSGMTMYLDNVSVATNGNTANYVNTASSVTIPWGAYKVNTALQAGWYANMQMDDIAIFTRIPTGSELTSLFSGTVATATGATQLLMGV